MNILLISAIVISTLIVIVIISSMYTVTTDALVSGFEKINGYFTLGSNAYRVAKITNKEGYDDAIKQNPEYKYPGDEEECHNDYMLNVLKKDTIFKKNTADNKIFPPCYIDLNSDSIYFNANGEGYGNSDFPGIMIQDTGEDSSTFNFLS